MGLIQQRNCSVTGKVNGYLISFFRYRLIILICLSLVPCLTWSNTARIPNIEPAYIADEIALQDISVLNGDLSIEINKDYYQADIKAKYHLDVANLLHESKLVFVANNLNQKKYIIKVDGKEVEGEIESLDTIPTSWLPPDSINFNEERMPVAYENTEIISFTVDSLSKGHHTLEVSYKAKVEKCREFDSKTKVYTSVIVFIFKPFNIKNLNLKIKLPPDWEYASNIELAENKNVLTGFWEELPSDCISIAFRPNESKVELFSWVFVVISFFLVLYLAFRWLKFVVNYAAEKKHKNLLKVLSHFFTSVIITLTLFLIFYFETELTAYLLDGQLQPLRSYWQIGLLFSSPFLVIIFTSIQFILDYILRRKRSSDNLSSLGLWFGIIMLLLVLLLLAACKNNPGKPAISKESDVSSKDTIAITQNINNKVLSKNQLIDEEVVIDVDSFTILDKVDIMSVEELLEFEDPMEDDPNEYSPNEMISLYKIILQKYYKIQHPDTLLVEEMDNLTMYNSGFKGLDLKNTLETFLSRRRIESKDYLGAKLYNFVGQAWWEVEGWYEMPFFICSEELIRWVGKNMVLAPDTKIGGISCQELYNQSFLRFFRLAYLSYSYAMDNDIKQQSVDYMTAVHCNDEDGLLYLKEKYKNALPEFYIERSEKNKTSEIFNPYNAIGFWLRRYIDGTCNELLDVLIGVLKMYDENWYASVYKEANHQLLAQQISKPEYYMSNTRVEKWLIDTSPWQIYKNNIIGYHGKQIGDTLRIPSKVYGIDIKGIDGYYSRGIGEKGIFSRSGIKYLELPDHICHISPYAFANNELTIVKIPDSLKVIETGVFLGNSIDSIAFSKAGKLKV